MEVASLYIYPVKGCRGISLDSAKLGPYGFLYDRFWMIVDESNTFVTQRQVPKIALLGIDVSLGACVSDFFFFDLSFYFTLFFFFDMSFLAQ